jgi:hypothetical protein
MTAARIREIVGQIGSSSPYWRLLPASAAAQVPGDALSQRLGVALADPALGWNLAASYADAGLELPPPIHEDAIIRAHRFLGDPDQEDVSIGWAYQLTMPENKVPRDLLRALLLCDASLEEIAQCSGSDLDQVTVFEALFWNCRDRRREPVYLARICGRGLFAPAKGAPILPDLLTTALGTGRIEDVLAQVEDPADTKPPDGYPFIARQILGRALINVRLGRVGPKENEELVPALRILSRMKKVRSAKPVAVPGPDAATAIGLSVEGMAGDDESHRQAVLEQERQAANAALAKAP